MIVRVRIRVKVRVRVRVRARANLAARADALLCVRRPLGRLAQLRERRARLRLPDEERLELVHAWLGSG